MISRDQVYTLLALRKRGDGIFEANSNGSFPLTLEIIQHISDMYEGPESEINIALRHAALGTTSDINILVEMVKANPTLLLQAGYVVTRCDIRISRVTLYEFFLGEGDPDGAKSIEFGFAKIDGGEIHRCRQYERYRPHVEALAKQIDSKQPAYDLRPLINIIKESTPADILAALNKDMTHKSKLQDAMCTFRKAVRPPKELKKPCMHYKHYTTLRQAVDLMDVEFEESTNNDTNYDKSDLIWGQIIMYLQLSLPAIDRFGFARAFEDNERTVDYKYGDGSFPDVSSDGEELPGVSINCAIFGSCGGERDTWVDQGIGREACWEEHMSSKNFKLTELMQQEPQQASERTYRRYHRGASSIYR